MEMRNSEVIEDKYDSLDKTLQQIIAMGDSIDSIQEDRIKNHQEFIDAQDDHIAKLEDKFRVSVGVAVGATAGAVIAGPAGALVGAAVGGTVGLVTKAFRKRKAPSAYVRRA